MNSSSPHDGPCGPHQAQTALAYSPSNLILNPFKTGTAFILAYCISLYVSADKFVMQIHTGKENIPDNLIHSGSSCNVGAAQQVVLWCLSLALKIKVQFFFSKLRCTQNINYKICVCVCVSLSNH